MFGLPCVYRPGIIYACEKQPELTGKGQIETLCTGTCGTKMGEFVGMNGCYDIEADEEGEDGPEDFPDDFLFMTRAAEGHD